MPTFSVQSKYLCASDLPHNDDKIVTIRSFTEETLMQGGRTMKKWVLWFNELDRGLALNKSNGGVICGLLGCEMDKWRGEQIALYVDPKVEYNGALVSGIRIRPRAITHV